MGLFDCINGFSVLFFFGLYFLLYYFVVGFYFGWGYMFFIDWEFGYLMYFG